MNQLRLQKEFDINFKNNWRSDSISMRWSNRALFKRVLIFYFQYNIVFLPIILKYLPDSICILIIQTVRRLESLNFVDSRKKLYNTLYIPSPKIVGRNWNHCCICTKTCLLRYSTISQFFVWTQTWIQCIFSKYSVFCTSFGCRLQLGECARCSLHVFSPTRI